MKLIAAASACDVLGDSAKLKKLKWPEWLPIRPTEIGIQWRNINANPEDFRLIVSADVTGIKGLPKVNVSGSITGLEFDVGALVRGENPLTGLQGAAVEQFCTREVAVALE